MAPSTVIVLASMWYQGHQLYDQRLARALAEYTDVIYVEPARAFGRDRSITPDPARNVPMRGVISPRMMPLGQRRLMQPITAVVVAIQIRRQLKRLGVSNRSLRYVVISSHAITLRILPTGRNVHLIKDDYVAGSALIGIDPKRILRGFYARMRLAESVVAVSPNLQQTLLQRGVRSTVVPAGCDIPERHYPCPQELLDIPSPKAVFIGMISDRIDFELVAKIVDSGITVVFVGPVQNTFSKHAELERVQQRDGFHLLPPRSGTALEAVLQNCQVGLIPYTPSDFNNASFPLKAFEYLAAGIPIVSTPLPAMSWLGYDVIDIATTHENFVRGVSRSAGTAEGIRDECRAIAVSNSWTQRGRVYADLLGLTA